MEFDQAFAGNADWHFPSPSATPTNASFGTNVMQTPKTSSFPSHFQDAFNTPQMPGYATPQQPQYPSMTPVQRPQSSSEVLRSNYYANMQAGSPLDVQPYPHSGHPTNVTSPGFQYPAVPYGHQLPLDSSQMQTPPPTRGMSAKKAQQPTQIAFGTPSTIASRRFMTPQQQLVGSVLPAQQLPMQFPQLQFSPDMYQFANLGPASAPVMPQTDLLWAQSNNQGSLQHRPLDDPFAPRMPQDSAWQDLSPQQAGPQAMMFDTPAMTSFPVQAPHPRPSSAAQPMTSVPAPLPTQTTSASLDPSLIYSSPIRPVLRSSSRTGKPRPELASTATKRKDSGSPNHSKNDSLSPGESVPTFTGAGLRRSNTTGTTRPKTAVPASAAVDSLSRSNSLTQVPRTASPLKRMGRLPLGSISEHKPRQRASVVLTVDENGRARTVTQKAEDSPTRSIRERYPGLFDSDSSDDDSETSELPPSLSASFTFTKGEERKPKIARLEPPVESLEGLSIPRSSSRASNGVAPSRAAIAAAAQLRKQGSVRRPSRNSTTKRNPMISSTSSLVDSCPMDLSADPQQASIGAEEHTDARDDMNAGSISRVTPIRPQSALDAHNRRWSMMSFDQVQPQPPVPYHMPYYPLPAQPRLVRCVCGVNQDQGQTMIQCRSCTQWLHAPCLGLNPQQPPPHFVCFLCTMPAHAVR